MQREIAALFVQRNGSYYGLDGVDPWDEERDARRYPGPHPVVAHPPCERWGRYWFGGPSCKVRKVKGDDGGCFASALASVRRWGGVLEHPEASHAFATYGLARPPKSGRWRDAGDDIGAVCCVEQGHYGHRARKATWLYAAHISLPDLAWGKSQSAVRLDDGYHSAHERALAKANGSHRPVERLSKRERAATPHQFRDLLVAMART